MRLAFTIGALAVAAALFSVAAQAQTGRPSFEQMQQQDRAQSPSLITIEQQPGSYARYLMLNGVTREAALKSAESIDHPRYNGREVRTVRAAEAAASATALQN